MKFWRHILLVVGIAIAVSLLVGRHVAQGADNKPSRAEDYDFLPVLLPPDVVTYVPQANTLISSPDKRPVAQLSQPYKGYDDSVEAFIPTIIPLEDPNQMAYIFQSSIRYNGKEGVVYVTTIKPSIPITKQIIGEETILLNKQKAVFIKDKDLRLNQLSFMNDDVIISIVGSLSQDQLKQIAASIVVVKE